MASRAEILKKAHNIKEKDLDDERTQAGILEPAPSQVEIGRKPVQLYPVSGRVVRELTGLAREVFADAAGDGPAVMRISGALTKARYLGRFIPIVAAATFSSPKELESAKGAKQHQAMIEEIDNATAGPFGADELCVAFLSMLEHNGILEAFVPSKNSEEPEAET